MSSNRVGIINAYNIGNFSQVSSILSNTNKGDSVSTKFVAVLPGSNPTTNLYMYHDGSRSILNVEKDVQLFFSTNILKIFC